MKNPFTVLFLFVCSIHAAEEGMLHQWRFDQAKVGLIPAKVGAPAKFSGTAIVAKEDGLSRLQLKGTDSRAWVADDFNTVKVPQKSITVEAWVSPAALMRWGGIAGIIQDNGDYERGWLLGYVNRKFSFALASEGHKRLTYLQGTTDFQDNRWYHVVGTYDGDTLCVYVNGKLEGTEMAHSGSIIYPPKATFELGGYKDDNEFYRGAIGLHEISIYEKALGAEGIAKRFAARKNEFPLPPEPLRFTSPPQLRWKNRSSLKIEWGMASALPVELKWKRADGTQEKVFKSPASRMQKLVLLDLPPDGEFLYRIEAQGGGRTKHASPWYKFDTSFHYRLPDQPKRPSPFGNDGTMHLVQSAAKRIIAESGIRQGYALVLGSAEGRLAYELARQTDLQVVVVEPDAEKAQAARRALTQAGLYGIRASVHQGSVSELPYGPYFANLIVSGGLLIDGKLPGKDASELMRVLRPAGGVAMLGQLKGSLTQADFEGWFKRGGANCTVSAEAGQLWAKVELGKLEGAGEWTHQYGSADNTTNSRDDLVRGEMGILWWGEPGPRPMPDRGGRNPAPLAANGRMFIQGDRVLFGVDAYNGTVLWTFFSPEMRRSNMPFNQFVIEQIAGDLLPSATVAQRIATGFHRTPTCNVEAGVHPEENRVNQVVDRVNTTGTVFLGTTLECAQCHDHKYDPFSMKDYYSLFAFFNNTPLEVKQEGKGVTWNFYGPKMDMPMSASQQAKLDELNKKQVTQKNALEKMQTDLKTSQVAWEKRTRKVLENTPHWSILTIDTFSATGEPTHKLQEDGSVLVSGKNPDKSTYTITTRPGLKKITAIRLEALTDSSMHKNGPGRNRTPVTNPNFILNSFNVMTDGKSIKLVSASSSISQKNWHINGTIDDDPKTGWGINPAFGKPAWAIFKLEKPLELAPVARLEFTLAQEYGGSRTIGRPRLSGISGDAVGLTVPANIAAILHKTKRTKSEKSELEKYYLASNPELKKLELQVLALDKQIKAVKPTNTLVMSELEKQRVTSVMLRGEYLNPGKKVVSATPSILHPIQKDLPRNRLGLAKWLVDPANPLIGRVTVNRFWAELMGHGIVSTQEDFGTQSEPPTHPALLDWLAVEFVERDWSMKHIHKLIVMSATYRQHSRVTPELLAKDASNKFYARAPRLRMSAEMIRDNALTISGLLSSKMHGPPIYPPQPGGIWRHVGRNAPKFNVATDENRFRRGVYVVWRRSAPYVSFVNFDAPDRSACVVKRSRTNTPLQALTLMNDEAYVEMAFAFAGRILYENKGGTEARILYAYKTAFARIPRPAETVYLKALLLKRHAFFNKNPKAAQTLIASAKGWKVPAGMDVRELAAWFYLTNILLNLDETIIKG